MSISVQHSGHPRLDMSHGFLTNIRKNLVAQAEELNSQSKPIKSEPIVQKDPMAGNKAKTAAVVQSKLAVDKEDKEHAKKCMISIADLPSYVPNAQPKIRLAIEESVKLSLNELGQVAQTLVERACEDVGYYDTAAILCGHIARNEEGNTLNTIPDTRFIRVVLHAIDQRMAVATQMRNADVRFWTNFCNFLGEAYMQMSLKGDRLLELQNLLFNIMTQLSCPPSCENIVEVDTFAMLFKQCGQDLLLADPEAFDKIICNIRDAFVAGRNKDINCILLMLVELFSSQWQLSDIAKEYYGLD